MDVRSLSSQRQPGPERLVLADCRRLFRVKYSPAVLQHLQPVFNDGVVSIPLLERDHVADDVDIKHRRHSILPVSYTHLTLPTIYSV